MNAQKSDSLDRVGTAARRAAARMAQLSGAQKNACLQRMAEALRDRSKEILEANRGDVEEARGAGWTPRGIERLMISADTIEELSKGIQLLAGISDPVGRVDATWIRPNGLKIEKVRVPVGVIAVVSDGAPTVPVEAAGICLKAGNALVLHSLGIRARTQEAFVATLVAAGTEAGLPEGAVQCVAGGDTGAMKKLVALDGLVDLVIPRGSADFVADVVASASVPVIGHRCGVCHIYVDEEADHEMALRIIRDATCERPQADDAVSVVLLHRGAVSSLGPRLAETMHTCGIELHADEELRRAAPGIKAAVSGDWRGESDERVLAVKVVEELGEAVQWIARHGAGRSDAIVTRDRNASARFSQAVDSACVYVNASTRFTDGTQFGMGGQIGFSTDRLHARGPLSTEELTTYKYVAVGTGQVRG